MVSAIFFDRHIFCLYKIPKRFDVPKLFCRVSVAEDQMRETELSEQISQVRLFTCPTVFFYIVFGLRENQLRQ
jgi:hypothetical protein